MANFFFFLKLTKTYLANKVWETEYIKDRQDELDGKRELEEKQKQKERQYDEQKMEGKWL